MHDDYRWPQNDHCRGSVIMMFISRMMITPIAPGDNASRSGEENGHAG
jgi:hypothetical protein